MYITDDVFPSYDLHTPPICTSNLPHSHWITMTEPQNAGGQLGKRKRLMDGQSPTSHHDTVAAQQQFLAQNKGMRRIQGLSSPDKSNRFRPASAYPISGNRPQKHIKLSPPKPALQKLPSHLMDMDLELPRHISNPTPAPPTIVASDLRACHICHSAPKRRKELENYLECQSCTERACYICARECSGGCRKQLCSKCCVEVGEEGDTYCLECYSSDVNSG